MSADDIRAADGPHGHGPTPRAGHAERRAHPETAGHPVMTERPGG